MNAKLINARCPYAPVYIVSPAETDIFGNPVNLSPVESTSYQTIECPVARPKSDKFFTFVSGVLLGVIFTCLALAVARQVHL